MKITATTTDEQILANVNYTKQALAAAVARTFETEYVTGESLVQAAQAVRNTETLAGAQMQYRDVLANRPEAALRFLFELVARGADDKWSGRGNDSNRSAHDTVVDWAKQEVSRLPR